MNDDDDDLPLILLSNRQDYPVRESELLDLARDCLRGEGLHRAELSVSLVSPEEMAELRARYLGEEGPTDVLSFPMDGDDDRMRVLGDVVIAPAVAASNNPDVPAELRLLLVHGILHLLGYDHEEEGERTTMWARQETYAGVRAS